MYNQHFGLHNNPFSIAPDPRFLFLGTRHEEALAHLLYGIIESRGFVQLTGEVGTGKTTVTRALLRRLPANIDVALILNPRLNATEFVASILDDLGVPYDPQYATLKRLVDTLNRYLLSAHARGRNVVVIVDEAQTLERDVLEQIRLLTNLETDERKLLQIVLVGQPELGELLSRHDLRQLAQRITARYHLGPISLQDTQSYIYHRLWVSGATNPIFSREAIRRIHKHTNGIPRLINLLCDRALLGAFSRDLTNVDAHIIDKAAIEVFAAKRRKVRGNLIQKVLISIGVALATATLTLRVADSGTLARSDSMSPASTEVTRAQTPNTADQSDAEKCRTFLMH